MLDLMSHVNEPRAAGGDGKGLLDGIVDAQVCGVVSLTEHVEKEGLKADKLGTRVLWNLRNICTPREWKRAVRAIVGLDTKPEDGQLAVHKSNGLDSQAVELNRLAWRQGVDVNIGDKRIIDVLVLSKDVFVDPLEMLNRMRLGPDVDRGLLIDIEAAYLVKTKGVINVIVCKEDAITPRYASAKHLLTEIG